jgi:acetyl-CoA carboxylase alpha subunit
MMDNAIFAPVSPEGAAALLYRDAGKAEEVADSLKLTARDCKKLGIIDVIVPEPEGGAHVAPEDASLILERQLIKELRSLRRVKLIKLLPERYKKFRRMGEYSSYFRDILLREVSLIQQALLRGMRGLRERLPSRRRVQDAGT